MRALILVVLAFAASSGFAVEQKDIKVVETWAVVGVIAGTDPKGHDIGIAVLRNTQTKHTYTLSIGDAVPNEFGFVLQSVQNRAVVIADGERQLRLSFAESSASGSGYGSEDEHENRTARFIDSYYRGLSDSPIEVFKSERDHDEATPDSDGSARDSMHYPLRRFGNYKDDASRSRFDWYRNDGATYAEPSTGEPEASDNSLIANFTDSYQDDEREVPGEPAPEMSSTYYTDPNRDAGRQQEFVE